MRATPAMPRCLRGGWACAQINRRGLEAATRAQCLGEALDVLPHESCAHDLPSGSLQPPNRGLLQSRGRKRQAERDQALDTVVGSGTAVSVWQGPNCAVLSTRAAPGQRCGTVRSEAAGLPHCATCGLRQCNATVFERWLGLDRISRRGLEAATRARCLGEALDGLLVRGHGCTCRPPPLCCAPGAALWGGVPGQPAGIKFVECWQNSFWSSLAVGETVTLLHPPPPLSGRSNTD